MPGMDRLVNDGGLLVCILHKDFFFFYNEAEVSVDNSRPRASTYGAPTAVCLCTCPLHQLLPPLSALVSWNRGYLLASCTSGLKWLPALFLKVPDGCVTSLVSQNVSRGAVPGLTQGSGSELLVSLGFSTTPSLYSKLPVAGDVAATSYISEAATLVSVGSWHMV